MVKPEEYFKSAHVRETLGNQSWLESKSKEDLIDIITYIVYEYFNNGETHSLKPPSPEITELDFGQQEISKDFIVLPLGAPTFGDSSIWEIALVGADIDKPPLSLRIVDEAVVGVRRLVNIDLNLVDYYGRERGVSRQHAAFVPTAETLFVKDLGSTNGTYINKKEIPSGEMMPLNDDDVVAFAELYFKVRILKTPKDFVKKEEEE